MIDRCNISLLRKTFSFTIIPYRVDNSLFGLRKKFILSEERPSYRKLDTWPRVKTGKLFFHRTIKKPRKELFRSEKFHLKRSIKLAFALRQFFILVLRDPRNTFIEKGTRIYVPFERNNSDQRKINGTIFSNQRHFRLSYQAVKRLVTHHP